MRCALAARTFCAMVMNGSSWSISKNSATRSSRIAGANGRNEARCFTRELSRSFMAACRGSARIERCPGADFGAPLEPTDDLSRGKIARDLLDELRLGQSLVRQAGLPEGVADFRVTVAKPVKGVSHL